ncbi:MAG: NAD(P)H-dependent glycerol-3-phosphate dehydrogenase [Pseudomonadota bacterium]
MTAEAAFTRIGVVGAGAWGTALAQLFAGNGADVVLWARRAAVADGIAAARENRDYLPGVALHERVRATHDLAALATVDAVAFVTPIQAARPHIAALERVAPIGVPVLLCSKGVERDTHALLTEVFAEVWPAAPRAVLSGPSFAADVARGMPTAVTLACADDALAARWSASLAAPHFRPYRSRDLVGVELAGAVKNVLAVAAGVAEGRGLGASARAAVIARGFAELARLAGALGAEPETLTGLSGLGDLVLTATSTQSRNMVLGRALGAGETLEAHLAGRRTVAEGAAAAAGVVALGRKAGVDLPICAAVADLVAGARTLDAIVADLLARPLPDAEHPARRGD